ncbi:hypothetical protein [Methanosarcina siciliae]|uniref:hypothetical protein n=1 Tax=Methanosarcina siciliae TaxID=38027 RepID=UPI00064E5D44|nr:hypothetical protein [Methanosarcina siciliae]
MVVKSLCGQQKKAPEGEKKRRKKGLRSQGKFSQSLPNFDEFADIRNNISTSLKISSACLLSIHLPQTLHY